MDYMYHRNSRQHKLLDSTAVAENRITGGVGEVAGTILSPRPDRVTNCTLPRLPRYELRVTSYELREYAVRGLPR